MKILKNIFKSFSKNDLDSHKVNMDSEIKPGRDVEVFGQDKLSKQRLYEKWVCKEDWRLYDEGIPLILGIDPELMEDIDPETRVRVDDLRSHAQDCVIKNLLPVINSEKPAIEWQVKPVDIYSWATVSRIDVPEELDALMSFVLASVKSTTNFIDPGQNESGTDVIYQKHREIILGAAVSLLVNSKDSCINKKGNVQSRLITQKILENEKQWFGESEPAIAVDAMNDLIDSYIKQGKPLV